MDFYHILICSVPVQTLLRTSNMSLSYTSVAYREPGQVLHCDPSEWMCCLWAIQQLEEGPCMAKKKKKWQNCSFGSSSTQGSCTLRMGRGRKGNMHRAVGVSCAHTYWQIRVWKQATEASDLFLSELSPVPQRPPKLVWTQPSIRNAFSERGFLFFHFL